MPGASQPALEIIGLGRRFGSLEAVRSLDLSLAPGERVALWGPNGSGKSTVLRCIAGTLEASRGRVLVEGFPAGSLRARRHIGVALSLERSFYLRLTGHNNLLFYARLRARNEADARDTVRRLEDELDLGDIVTRTVGKCSSGMIQQLGLARALIGDPAVLLLDEPTKSMDAGARARLWAALDRRPTTAVMLATHLSDDLEYVDRRVTFPV